MTDGFVISAVITIVVFILAAIIVKLVNWLSVRDSKVIKVERQYYDSYHNYETAKLMQISEQVRNLLGEGTDDTYLYDCLDVLEEISEGHKSAKQNREH